jgi:phage-related protein (TIGR01555 family)
MFARLRAAWRAFWNSGTSLPAIAAPAEDGKRPNISYATLWEADRGRAVIVQPEQTFQRPKPLKGTMPDGMAFDNLPPLADAGASIYNQMFSEGLGFLGYAYLAELSQRAEYINIVSTWAEHCTRKWIKITGSDEKKIAEIEAEFRRLCVQEVFHEAIEKECFFGRSQIFMDFGDFANDAELKTPLVMDSPKVNPKRPLKALKVVEPLWSYPGIYEAVNPLSPRFYRPSEWYMSGRTVHDSRLLTMVSHDMPTILKPAYAFGGVSLTQMCKPYVDNWLGMRQSVADFAKAYSVMVLKTDMEQMLQGDASGANLFKRVDFFNKTRDNRGTFVIDKASEDFANVSANISGLDKLLAQSQEQMSSVSKIPLVILLSITPTGLNASSEGEFRVFYDTILSYNTKVCRGPVHTILQAVQLSLYGKIDEEISFQFVPLWEMTDKDRSDIRKSDADAAGGYIDRGVISPEEERTRLNQEEGGAYHGMLDGPAPEIEDDEDGQDVDQDNDLEDA